MLPQDTDADVLTINTTLTVLEDQRYTAVVSFSNLAGEFSNSSTVDFSKDIKKRNRKQFVIEIYNYIIMYIHKYEIHVH